VNIEVHHVEVVDLMGGEYFMVTYRVDADDIWHAYTFPTDMLETRAAEYGLDPADVDQLIEIILYEPHVQEDSDDPDLLHNADTIAKARVALLQRIADAKGNGQITGLTGQSDRAAAGPSMTVLDDSGVDHPLEFLKANVRIDPGHYHVKRQFIAKVREKGAATRAVRKARRARIHARERESAEVLRDQLLGVAGDPTRQPPLTAAQPTGSADEYEQ